jgi:ribosomal-protein-alanine N-acetyltransferase
MTVADLDVLLPFELELFGTEAWSRQAYLDELADQELRCYFVAEDSAGQLLGSAGVLTIGETAQLLTIGVVPAARRRGVGRLLLQTAIEQAELRRATELLLEVRVDNEPAIRLYESEGFAVLGTRRGYYDRGRIDALTLRLALPDGTTHRAIHGRADA